MMVITIIDHSYDCPEDALLFRFREEDVAAFDDNVQLQEALLPFQHLQMTEILGEGKFISLRSCGLS